MTQRTGDQQDDLKRREYRDDSGEIHHHTHPYMEEHRGTHRSSERQQAEPRSGGEDRRAGSHSGGSAHPLTDHDEIRRWAEARGGRPTCVKGTGGKGDAGIIRLDFPGYSGADSLQPISWDEWFKAFDDNDLALIVQDETADGQESQFNKLVSRDNAQTRAR